tara:strand:+ start:773 stop:1174 length:402 start_codon:yes stop_codon:yes gene_type:complete
MHRVATWMFYKQQPSRNLVFPYKAQSPTLKKSITYTEEELWNEIDRALEEDKEHKFTPGANLYYNLVFCADSKYFCNAETNFMLEEYMSMKRFNLPLARTLDDAEYERVVIFSAIDEEYNALINEKTKKQNNG